MGVRVIEKQYYLKRCSKCGRLLSSGNFSKDKYSKDGLKSYCKECAKEYREQNKDKIKEYREQNKDKKTTYNKEYQEQNKEKLSAYHKEYRERNKNKISAYQKEYRERNKDKISAYKKEWHEQNKDKISAYHKEYRKRNKEKLSAYHKEYSQTPRGQVVAFNHHHKRRTQKQTQGNGITTEQWLECMSFFDWRCAYSGKSVSKQEDRELDHIVPLNKGGAHEIWNVVPMYGSYNSSKWIHDMEEWYEQQDYFSEERLAKIRAWQDYAYEKWGMDNGKQTK